MASIYSKRHYVDMANFLGGLDISEFQFNFILERMMERFERDNPLFDAERFEHAAKLMRFNIKSFVAPTVESR